LHILEIEKRAFAKGDKASKQAERRRLLVFGVCHLKEFIGRTLKQACGRAASWRSTNAVDAAAAYNDMVWAVLDANISTAIISSIMASDADALQPASQDEDADGNQVCFVADAL